MMAIPINHLRNFVASHRAQAEEQEESAERCDDDAARFRERAEANRQAAADCLAAIAALESVDAIPLPEDGKQ